MIFIGNCYLYLANELMEDVDDGRLDEIEVQRRYAETIEYYEIAESYGYYCHSKKERCKNRRK